MICQSKSADDQTLTSVAMLCLCTPLDCLTIAPGGAVCPFMNISLLPDILLVELRVLLGVVRVWGFVVL